MLLTIDVGNTNVSLGLFDYPVTASGEGTGVLSHHWRVGTHRDHTSDEVGLVDGMVDRIRAELGYPTAVIATGGLATLVAPESRTIEHVEPNLTLEGLRLLHERNSR